MRCRADVSCQSFMSLGRKGFSETQQPLKFKLRVEQMNTHPKRFIFHIFSFSNFLWNFPEFILSLFNKSDRETCFGRIFPFMFTAKANVSMSACGGPISALNSFSSLPLPSPHHYYYSNHHHHHHHHYHHHHHHHLVKVYVVRPICYVAQYSTNGGNAHCRLMR